MDILLRAVAIFVEVLILAAIFYSLLFGVWLTLFDLGLGPKYKRMVTTVLIVAGSIVLVFLIAHLTAFYPAINGG